MFRFATPVLSAFALVAGLSGCVTPTTPVAGTETQSATAQPAVSADAMIAYAATKDANFTVPGLPVDQIPEQFRRQTVLYPTDQVPGTIVINPAQKVLYYVTGKNTAIRYGIAVGREGFQWSGEALVTEKKMWPTWTPPKEMIARKPELAKWEKGQPGGLENPLGARAIYLTTNGIDYGYRIHGTPEWQSIGRNASSGCIRMINQDVMDLFNRVKGGEKVIVLTASGEMPKGLTLPPPAPVAAKKKSPTAEPATLQPAAVLPKLQTLPPPAITLPGAVPLPVAPATVTPAVATPTPDTTPAVPVCKVPLVNGTCPKA